MTSAATEFAAAKINLALAVTGRRPDGYHLLDTLVAFADVGDRLDAVSADHLSLSVEGPFASELSDPGSNLVLRAARALRKAAFGPMPAEPVHAGAALTLDKRLPVASGIGGGSADAAAALRALKRLWGLNLGLDDLAATGLTLGADVPMCLHGVPLRARGIGEDIAPLTVFPPLDIVLVNPGVGVSTPEIFARLSGVCTGPLPDPAGLRDPDDVLAYLQATANDLEAPAIAAEPAIAAVLESLGATPGCRLARMSGSGATCFGIYPDAEAARTAAAAISSDNRLWWVSAATTGGS